MNGTTETWLTQEAHDRLQGELEHLQGPVRAEIAKRIEEARDEGDLKENGGYHAAKDDQAQIEARIAQITQLLRTAKVGEAPQASGVVEPGTVVKATIAGDPTTFLVGNREIQETGDLDVYSEASPLGSAIMGLKIGAKTSYEAPSGATIEVEILDVQTYRP
ncbi:transcription elongation factor GreA [Agrococcus sp. SL85]|uniref:transcription elongation factor GreA n=1 Tax=Agrococcus sp. SL85 TaxID=2995141 RepID=UPI00226CF609|nr:transcription elongation factor GreA [Agrococcus sp. SL85]WAC65336.1 transcription elongation factor GreA [Agrococcus sp. SL85]